MYSVRYQVPGTPDEVKGVAKAIMQLAREHGFADEAADDINVSLHEAWRRVTCHGFEGWSDCVDVECNLTDDEMEIVIRDPQGSHGIAKNGIEQCKLCPQEGDLAFFVMESLMSEVSVDKDEKGSRVIRMVKRK